MFEDTINFSSLFDLVDISGWSVHVSADGVLQDTTEMFSNAAEFKQSLCWVLNCAISVMAGDMNITKMIRVC